jgi:L-glutamine-phosphate cytidylyltransferase
VRVILLAAGRGERLRPLTDDRPKCLVEVGGQPLLAWQLAALSACGLDDLVLVRGYRASLVHPHGVRTHDNPCWERTNMVVSLSCALDELHGDVLIVYTDLLFGPSTVRAALASSAEIGVIVDRRWRELWQRRMEDPLRDAETLRLDELGRIVEIGGRPQSLDEIQGQYVGIIRLSPQGSRTVRESLREASRLPATEPAFGSSRAFERAHMTDLLMGLVRREVAVQAIPIDGGWMEVDTVSDLAVAESMVRELGWAAPTTGAVR